MLAAFLRIPSIWNNIVRPKRLPYVSQWLHFDSFGIEAIHRPGFLLLNPMGRFKTKTLFGLRRRKYNQTTQPLGAYNIICFNNYAHHGCVTVSYHVTEFHVINCESIAAVILDEFAIYLPDWKHCGENLSTPSWILVEFLKTEHIERDCPWPYWLKRLRCEGSAVDFIRYH